MTKSDRLVPRPASTCATVCSICHWYGSPPCTIDSGRPCAENSTRRPVAGASCARAACHGGAQQRGGGGDVARVGRVAAQRGGLRHQPDARGRLAPRGQRTAGRRGGILRIQRQQHDRVRLPVAHRLRGLIAERMPIAHGDEALRIELRSAPLPAPLPARAVSSSSGDLPPSSGVACTRRLKPCARRCGGRGTAGQRTAHAGSPDR